MAKEKQIVEIYSDLSYNPSLNQLGDLSTVINEQSIKQSIRTIVNTPKGSRIFEPDFGCNVGYYLFEQMSSDVGFSLGKDLQNNINKFEPRIEILNINVVVDTEEQSYSADILYRVLETQKVDRITVSLQRL
jgi:phage baseplate assembly protein W